MKMTMHARSGGHLEVMGLMQGYVMQETFIVTDAFRLPVEGTETRVNAQDEANEYIVEYLDLCRKQGRAENVVGWYHSHPGYGCWLSGIDVDTQSMQQSWSDPFLAIVIDPIIATGSTVCAAIDTLRDWGVPRIIAVSVLASQAGLQKASEIWPQGVELWVGGVDAETDEKGMIKPGLGDVGDRLFLTVGK